jgi:hypothetical protein
MMLLLEFHAGCACVTLRLCGLGIQVTIPTPIGGPGVARSPFGRSYVV